MTVLLSPFFGGGYQAFNNSGVPLAGGRIYTYLAGTTTPATTYTTISGAVANANPIVLDSGGRPPQEVWLPNSVAYKFTFTDSVGNPVGYTVDNITGINGTGIATNALNVQYDPAGTGAVATTVQAKLRQTVSVLDFGANTVPGTTDMTAAIQAAVNAAYRVYIPAGTYKVTSTITLKAGTYIYGDGMGATFINSTATGATFELLNPLGTSEIESPKFFDFYLYTTGSGIRLNTQSDPFLDDNTSQSYMMRPIIERVIIVGSQNATGYAVSWNKCFDGLIRNCKFVEFQYGIVFYGCDLNQINNNRIQSSGTNCIAAISVNTFGSQTLIFDNDLLGAPSESFITSSDRDILIQNNYLEGSGTITSTIYISGGFYVKIDGNRIEVQSDVAANWLKVGSAAIVNLAQLWVTNNVNNGTGWGPALFNAGGGSRYFYNSQYRQKIFHQNNASEAGFPFNTLSDDSVIYPLNKYIWVLTPSNSSIQSGGNGVNIYVKNNEFVIPVVVSPIYIQPTTGVAGAVDVLIVAYSAVASQVLQTYWGNVAGTNIGNTNLTLTTTPAVYTAFNNISPTSLILTIQNADSTRNGNVFIQQIIVQYH